MSRSGYSDDCENLALYRGQVASATRGKRGQRMFCELKTALEAMPIRRLIAGDLVVKGGRHDGEVCALGVLGKARGIDMSALDPEDAYRVGESFDIARQLAAEVVYENDEANYYNEDPENRWERMHKWVCSQIVGEP